MPAVAVYICKRKEEPGARRAQQKKTPIFSVKPNYSTKMHTIICDDTSVTTHRHTPTQTQRIKIHKHTGDRGKKKEKDNKKTPSN